MAPVAVKPLRSYQAMTSLRRWIVTSRMVDAPQIDRRLLGRSKDLVADASTLEFRSHGEHAEVREIGVMLCRQLAATDESVTLGEQHDCAGPFEQVNEHRSVDALTVDKIGFGGPTGATAVAAICRLHQIDHCGYVFAGRVAEGELGHRPGPRMVIIEVCAQRGSSTSTGMMRVVAASYSANAGLAFFCRSNNSSRSAPTASRT